MNNITLLEEIAKQLKFDNTHPNLKESYISQSYKILKIIEARIDNKIKLCDQEMENSEHIALNDCLGCIESKKKAFQEILEMLNKK